jgi:hypothetical protein
MSLKVEGLSTSAQYPILDQQIARIDSLRGLQLRSAQQEPTLSQLRQLVEFFPRHIVSVPDGSACSWWRGRLCKEGECFESTDQMRCPPVGVDINRGRVNGPGERFLYASRGNGTCLSGLSGETGNHYQLAKFVLRSGAAINALVIGEIEYRHQSNGLSLLAQWGAEQEVKCLAGTGEFSLEQQCSAIVVDAFIAEQFALKAHKAFDYKLTNWLVSVLLERGDANAVIYPSVQHRGGLNIAIPADVVDSSLDMVDGEYGQIEQYVGYGMHILHQTHRVNVVGERLEFVEDEVRKGGTV